MEKLSKRLRRQKRQTIAVKCIRALFRGVNGFDISSQYRSQISLENKETTKPLTYGEIEVKSFLQILLWIERNEKNSVDRIIKPKIFYDLGCGTGRACLTAALSIGEMFDRVVGIDLVPGLIDLAISTRDKLIQTISQLSKTKSLDSTNLITSKTPSNTKQNTKDKSFDLLTVALEAAKTFTTGEIPVDSLANLICKKLGHKLFKNHVKLHKSFTNFLKKNDSLFEVSNDVKMVTLKSSGELQDMLNFQDELKHTTDYDGDVNSDVNSDGDNNDHDHDDSNGIESVHVFQEVLFANMDSVEAILPIPSIDYITRDIFDTVWYKDCYVAYAASLLFTEDMMERLTEQVMLQDSWSWFISLQPLIRNNHERQEKIKLVHESFFDMSWEMTKVYIYQLQEV